MGQKLSVVTGVKSLNFTQPGNAINEIWAGNTEIISHLPFGDSDMSQASWPKDGLPKIPWHNFIIPMKRDFDATTLNLTIPDNMTITPAECLAYRPLIIEVPLRIVHFLPAFFLEITALAFMSMARNVQMSAPRFNPRTSYEPEDVRLAAFRACLATWCLLLGLVTWVFAGLALLSLYQISGCTGWWECPPVKVLIPLGALFDVGSTIYCVHTLWIDWKRVNRVVDLQWNGHQTVGVYSKKKPLVHTTSQLHALV
ncbi:hypothetical protein BDW59DRAFT_150166 [Aspergillus cavernicola]|uniref:Uncharacterized protein n=1 Tax=Aspergillus cavernicola TaxID=176166 RepID=A0ABR4I3B1_9EURO